VRIDVLSSEIGCDCPKTLLKCANRLVWLDSRGTIFTIIASNQYSKGNVYELSLNIEPFLKTCSIEDMQKAFAVQHGGYYVLFIGSNAVVMDFTIKGFRYVASCSDQKNTNRNIYWYLWQMPSEITWISGTTIKGEALLIGCRLSDENFWYGTATLSGEVDCIPVGRYENLSIEKRNIPCAFKTKSFDFNLPNVKKTLREAYLYIGNKEPVTLTIFDQDVPKVKTVIPANETGEVRLKSINFFTTALNLCALEFRCDGYAEFCGFQLHGGI